MRRLLTLAASCALAAGAGCIHQSPAPAHPDRAVITRQQLADSHFVTAYDAVESMHQSWFETRGPDSFSTPTRVIGYVDGVQVGGVEALRNIPVSAVVYIRHYDGVAATARWGLGHGAGVIFVSTRPETSEASRR